MRRILDTIGYRLDEYERDVERKKAYCNEMLKKLDQIRFVKETNWLFYYHRIILECYGSFVDDGNMFREQIAKYLQLMDAADEIYANELNSPVRIAIIEDFCILYHHLCRLDIGLTVFRYLQTYTAVVRAQSKGSLTDFEFEESQWYLDIIEIRLQTIN